MPLNGPRIATPWRSGGSIRWRKSFFGKLILQVDEFRLVGHANGLNLDYKRKETRWRDAKAEDVPTIYFRGVLE